MDNSRELSGVRVWRMSVVLQFGRRTTGGGNGKSPVRDWEREREEAPESHLGPRKSEKVRDGREEKKEKKDIIKCLDGAVRWRLESSAWLLAPSAGAEGNPSSYRACVFKWWWLNAQA